MDLQFPADTTQYKPKSILESAMIISPKIRSFICTTAHPTGCAANVQQQIDVVKQSGPIKGPKKVLVLGASTGYGLASRISAAFGAGAATIGVSFERPASGKRTASAGWYNTAAFETAAHKAGLYAKSINGDAFSDEIKKQTLDLIRQDWNGEVDLVIYSLASPRRIHPKSGEIFNSVLKPIGQTFNNKSVNVMSGDITNISIEPADQADIDNTIAVMGGEDWTMWLNALQNAKLLAKGIVTLAYSYIGPELTFPIYRDGTIGAAKKDLEQTAFHLTQQLAPLQGHAYISVNKGLVTQASAAIPVVPLYISLLYKVMKEKGIHEGCIEQILRLFSEKLYNNGGPELDTHQFLRVDDWEMRDDVQQAVQALWGKVSTENFAELSDIKGYRHEFHKLFGFEVAGVDYSADVDPEVTIPSLAATV